MITTPPSADVSPQGRDRARAENLDLGHFAKELVGKPHARVYNALMAATIAPRSQYGKYNAEGHQVIVAALRAGNSKSTSFRLGGVHPDTGFDWMRKGLDEDKYPELAKFREDVEFAVAECQQDMISVIRTQAMSGFQGSWTAAAWFLERTDPEHFGKRDHVKVEADQPLHQTNTFILGDPDARAAGRGLLNRLANDGTREPIGIGVGDELTPEDD